MTGHVSVPVWVLIVAIRHAIRRDTESIVNDMVSVIKRVWGELRPTDRAWVLREMTSEPDIDAARNAELWLAAADHLAGMEV